MTRKVTKTFVGACPECDSDVRFEAPPRLGQETVCPDCGSRLEVIGTAPIELDWVYDDEDDDSYEDAFEDFDEDW